MSQYPNDPFMNTSSTCRNPTRHLCQPLRHFHPHNWCHHKLTFSGSVLNILCRPTHKNNFSKIYDKNNMHHHHQIPNQRFQNLQQKQYSWVHSLSPSNSPIVFRLVGLARKAFWRACFWNNHIHTTFNCSSIGYCLGR